eukprot:157537_1
MSFIKLTTCNIKKKQINTQNNIKSQINILSIYTLLSSKIAKNINIQTFALLFCITFINSCGSNGIVIGEISIGGGILSTVSNNGKRGITGIDAASHSLL